jgi:DNA repair exonuclease SbcCD ATPase subunit
MQSKYNFIKFQNIVLRNFSLYKKNGKVHEVSEAINEGVYCLAGANGLGKTTFMNSINYGLTGVVLEPNREPYSPSEIVNENKKYTERYFKGRINASDEEKAEIEILFSINDKFFRISRGFFERDGLRLLEVYKMHNGKKDSLFYTKNENSKELNSIYQNLLPKEIGFANFDYFIFFQLYVLTFDENRRMIFWDDRASSNALAVAFNSDPNEAERISDITRKMEKHESNARNLKWQSTQAKKKIEELSQKIKAKPAADFEKLEKEYGKLHKDLENYARNIKIIHILILKPCIKQP